MGKIEEARRTIDQNIRTNGTQEITGGVLNVVLNDMMDATEEVSVALPNKVDKEQGKGLSTNDFTDAYKTAIDTMPETLGNISKEVAQKAEQDGKYPSLTSGFANNLVGRGESTESEFSFRASGGKSIEDGAARISELRGNGVVVNQQLRPISSEYWYVNSNDATSEYSDNYCRLTVAHEESALPANGVVMTAGPSNRKPTIPNHAYLITADIRVSVAISVGIRNFSSPWGGDYKKNAQANTWTRVAFIESRDVSYSGQTIVGTTTNIGLSVGDTIDVRNVAVIDLTLMFGAGNEPTTIEEFYARKPIGVDEYAYNEGTLIPFNADAIKSVGDNAWDEEFESGTYNSITGEKEYNPSMLRSKHLIKVLPNTEYYITVPQEVYGRDAVRQRFYTADGSYIGYDGQATNSGIFKTPLNCEYIGLNILSPTYNYDISIVLMHSGWKAEVGGGYKPYEDFVREIDPRIREAFPNGMKPWDKVYNKNGKGYIAKGSGEVDMGSQSWEKASEGWYQINFNMLKNDGQLISPYHAYSTNYLTAGDMSIASASQYVVIRDSRYTDAAAFKAAMAGVPLWYELADEYKEVIEYDEPFNLDYEVWDFGTEEILSEQPSAPISADIIYQFNAVDTIRNNQIEIAQLKAMIATMQAQMASMVTPAIEE